MHTPLRPSGPRSFKSLYLVGERSPPMASLAKLFLLLVFVPVMTHAALSPARISVNCGGPTVSFGNWVNDSAYCFSADNSRIRHYDGATDVHSVHGAAPEMIYRTSRTPKEDSLTYRFRQYPEGRYTVRLHSAAQDGPYPPGIVFSIEGSQVLRLRELGDAPSQSEGLVAETTIEVMDSEGIDIVVENRWARICGIEIIPWDTLGPLCPEYGEAETSRDSSSQCFLSGVILDRKSGPLRLANITLANPAAVQFPVIERSISDNSGWFCLKKRRVPAVLFVDKQGYVPEEIFLDSFPDTVRVNLKKYSRCVVMVHDAETGSPSEDATVTMRADGFTNLWTSTTSHEGHAYMERLVPDRYTLSVSAPGYLAKDKMVNFKQRGSDTISVGLDRGMTISGKVVSVSEDGKPVAGASVIAFAQDRRHQESVTDSNGNYTISGLPFDGRVHLGAGKEGYIMEDHRVRSLNLSISGNVSEEQTTLKLIRPASLTVSILSDSDLKNRNATLRNKSRTGHLYRHPIRDNKVVFKNLKPGIHTFSIEVMGFLPSKDTTMTFLPGTEASLMVRVEKGKRITGVVLDRSRVPIPGVNVLAADRSSGLVMPYRRGSNGNSTDSLGVFSIGGLQDGTNTITFRHPDFILADTAILVERDVKRLEMVLTKGARISGTVKSFDGRPLIRSHCDLRPLTKTQAPPVATRRIKDDGSFSFSSLAGGDYLLSIHSEGSAVTTREISVRPGEHRENIHIRMEKGYSVTGTVYQGDRVLSQGTVIMAPVSNDRHTYGNASVDAQGRFEISGLKRTSYEVRVRVKGGGFWPGAAMTVTPPARDIAVRLEEKHDYVVEGTVVDENGGLLDAFKACVIVAEHSQQYEGMVSKDFFDGSFSIPLPGKGLFRVLIRAPGYADCISEPFEVVEGTETYRVESKVRRGVSLTGVVEDESGVPLKGVQVSANMSIGGSYRSPGSTELLTDLQGRFGFKNINTEQTTLSFQKNGYVRKRIALSPETVGRGALKVTLVEGGSVKGVAYHSDNSPVSGARVFVSRNGANQYYFTPYQSTTEENGTFEITGIAPGSWVIVVEKIGISEQVKIEPGKKLELELRQKLFDGEIEGTVTLGGVAVRDGHIELDDPFQSIAGFKKRTTEIIGGVFRFENVAPGTYSLKYTFQNPRGMLKLTDNVEVAQGETVTPVIDLPQTEIMGRVWDGEKNVSLHGFTLSLNDRDELFWYGFSDTDDQGGFSFTGIQPGNYVLHLIRSDFMKKIVPVTVVEGQKVVVDDIVMKKGKKFICKVETESGEVGNGNYFVYDRQNSRFVDRFGAGGLEFSSHHPLEEGEYLVTLGWDGYLLGDSYLSLGNEHTIRITMKPCKPMKVLVRDQNDKPVEDAYVYLKKQIPGMPEPISQHPHGWLMKSNEKGEARFLSYFGGMQSIVAGHPAYEDTEVAHNAGDGSSESVVIVRLRKTP